MPALSNSSRGRGVPTLTSCTAAFAPALNVAASASAAHFMFGICICINHVKKLCDYAIYTLLNALTCIEIEKIPCVGLERPHLLAMMEEKLNWKRPLFFALLPIFLVMIFLGFPFRLRHRPR